MQYIKKLKYKNNIIPSVSKTINNNNNNNNSELKNPDKMQLKKKNNHNLKNLLFKKMLLGNIFKN
jgi:hypothetical protein